MNTLITTLILIVILFCNSIPQTSCLYVVNEPDSATISVLTELNFSVTISDTIPEDLSAYEFLLIREYTACIPSTALIVKDFISKGGGALLIAGTPAFFAASSDLTSISEWFGAGTYTVVDTSDALVEFDNPLGTSLLQSTVVASCPGLGCAAVTNVHSDVTVLTEWTFGISNYHSFIRPYVSGRVSYWSIGNFTNSDTRELFKALCQWTVNQLTSVTQNSGYATDFLLHQNYPNPFNPSTSIKYQIYSISNVSLKVYDVLGNEVAELVNEQKPSGSYEVKFDASGRSSGIYFYKLQAGSFTEVKKMILIR